MKYKLTLFSLAFFILLISLSLVYAFESPVYHIGIEIPSDGDEEEPTDNGDVTPSGGGRSSYDDDEDGPIIVTVGTTDTNVSDEEPEEITLTEPPKEGFFSRITGAVVGGVTDFAKSEGGTTSLIFIGLIGILTALVVVRNHRLKKKSSKNE